VRERGISLRKQLLISSKEQVEIYRTKIIDTTNDRIKDQFQNCEGIELLRKIKFTQSGFDPLFDESTNFIEMTNQVFTYLVCLKAVDFLLIEYPSHKFYVNFGTESGYDVISEDESIICECFAATIPDNNLKLEKDVKKVFENKQASQRYVIFYVSNPKPIHVENIKTKYQGVKIISLNII